MKFTKQWLIDTLGDKNNVELSFLEVTRWAIVYRRVFKFQEKFYESIYSVGATECQDERPYEYDPDEIECKEVFPVQKTITVYE